MAPLKFEALHRNSIFAIDKFQNFRSGPPTFSSFLRQCSVAYCDMMYANISIISSLMYAYAFTCLYSLLILF